MATSTIRGAQDIDGPEIFQIISMVGVESRGRGVGRTLLRSEGFEVIGTAPRAFRHAGHGFVGLHIMWKDLAFLRVLL